ncbi:MAG: transcriptional regulator BetI [Aurantimonas sp.]|nr:transcriptional regulator BetI [Aurantimonas sp.]
MTQLKTSRLGRGGIETERRQALIGAVIGAVEQAGSIEVTMADIAARAGVSPALAHHYFGAKDDLLIAAMRQLLREFRAEVTRRLIASRTPRERVSAVIEAAFDESQFRREAISAWLVFYVYARRSSEAARLLRVYFRRLETNLISGLEPLVGPVAAVSVAATTGAMIDGVWLRQALTPLTAPDRAAAVRMIERVIDAEIAP